MTDARPINEYPRYIHSKTFYKALLQADVLREGEGIRRVVIDAEHGHAVVMYVERYGDERLLKVVPTLEGVEVTSTPNPEFEAADHVEIEQVERLRIEPGETLVAKVAAYTSAEQVAQLADQLKEKVPDGVDVLVTSGVDLSVISKAEVNA